MDYREFSAKTIDEAITKACLDLSVTSDMLDYQVVQEPTAGFLGIGSKPAIVRAGVKAEEKAPAAPKKEEPAPKKIVTSDEIEKRAAAAALKEKAVPEMVQEEKKPEEERPQRAKGERRRRDGRRPGRREDFVRTEHEPSRPKPERQVEPKSEEEVAVITNAAETFLKDVFRAMDTEVKMTTSYDQKEGSLNISFDGEDMGILIGKRGQTLDSLQYLTSLVVNKGRNEYTRVKLDTEDYRSRRADTLNNLARNIAFKVKRTHRPVSLEPMNPYERRIIHSALQSNHFVETYSEGEEPYRHVVVAPKR